jgi:hypothetical protein
MDLGLRGTAVTVDASGTVVDSAEQLNARLDPDAARQFVTPTGRAYVGHARPDDVLVSALGPTGDDGRRTFHPWKPVFRGRFAEVDGDRSRLEGRIRVQVVVPVFTIVWLLLVVGWLSAGVPFLIGRLQEGVDIDANKWIANLILPLGFGAAIVVLYWYGSRLYERDRRELEAFLRGALA